MPARPATRPTLLCRIVARAALALRPSVLSTTTVRPPTPLGHLGDHVLATTTPSRSLRDRIVATLARPGRLTAGRHVLRALSVALARPTSSLAHRIHGAFAPATLAGLDDPLALDLVPLAKPASAVRLGKVPKSDTASLCLRELAATTLCFSRHDGGLLGRGSLPSSRPFLDAHDK